MLFDPKLDIALLRAPGVRAPTLSLAPGTLPRGTPAVVMGFPEGGPFHAGGARVLARTNALGRDIYGQGLTERTIYQLEAVVRPGNSGGPLVGVDGTVIGVVFARSTSNPDIGFALTSDEVAARVRPALGNPQPTTTGSCAA